MFISHIQLSVLPFDTSGVEILYEFKWPPCENFGPMNIRLLSMTLLEKDMGWIYPSKTNEYILSFPPRPLFGLIQCYKAEEVIPVATQVEDSEFY